MNLHQNDFNALLGLLSIAADKDFTEKQTIELVAALRNLGWEGSCRVIEGIRTSANIPRNLFGYTISAIRDEYRYLQKQKYQKLSWHVADEDKASPEEFCITMRIIGLLCRLENSSELLFKFGEYMEKAVTQTGFLEIMQRAEKFYSDQITAGQKLKNVTAEVF